MRSILAALLTVTVTVTGFLVAWDLALVLGSPPVAAGPGHENPSSPDDISLAHQFYDAVNELLAGKNGLGLQAVVAPGVLVHSAAGAPGNFDALTTHFAALQQQGDLRLSAVQLVGDEIDITALVEAHAPASGGLSEGSAPSPALWQAVDRFRVRDGMIAEYWPGAIVSRPLPALPRLAVDLTPPDAVVALSRLELGPGANMRALTIPAPQLVFVEIGVVTLPRPNAVSIARAGELGFASHVESSREGDVLLGPGDAVLIPAGNGQDLFNRGEKPAAVLSFLFADEDALYGSRHSLPQDLLVAAAMHDPGRIGARTEWATGVVSETLAIGPLPSAGSSHRNAHISGHRVTLDPGQESEQPSSSRLRFALVMSGIMSVRSAQSAEQDRPLQSTDEALPLPAARLLRAGDALSVAPGAHLTIETGGATRLDLAMIEVEVGTSG